MARRVFCHYMAGTGISINNIAIPNDYYSVQLMTPNGEPYPTGTKHTLYGGYQRDAPMEVPGLVRPRGGDFKLLDLAYEITRAKQMGLDGFIPDIQSFVSTDSRWIGTKTMLQAAQNDGTFKVMLCPDMNVLPAQTAAGFATAIAELAAYPSALRLGDNRLVMTAFLPQQASAGGPAANYTNTFWTAAFGELHALGIAVAFIPMPTGAGISTAVMDQFDTLTHTSNGLTSSTYGYAPWGNRDTATMTATTAASTMRARSGNSSKIWMHPVAFHDSRPSASIFYENEGTKLLRQGMADAAAISGTDDFVQVITWNDYKEHSGVGQMRRRKSDNDGLQTPGDILKYYSPKFKTGSFPTLTEDAVHITHRSQLSAPQLRLNQALVAGTPYTSLTVFAVPSTFRPQAGEKLHTTLGEVITVAAQPATNATTLSIQSWTPANAYSSWGTGRALIKPFWTYVPPSGNYKPMANNRFLNSTSATDTVDTVEVLTYLTPGATPADDATVTVTVGGVAQTPYVIPGNVAEHVQVYPAAVGSAPSAVVVRNAVTIMSLTSLEAITATPYAQDVLPITATEINPPPSPPPPPELPVVTRLQLAGGLLADWTAENPTLIANEVAVVELTDGRKRLKVGPGAFSSLPYYDDQFQGDVQVFTASGTWTKPSREYSTATITVIGPGSGGGGGRRDAAATARVGGGGGSGGARTFRVVPFSLLGATETVTVATPGAAGAAATANATNGGNGGNASGISTFGIWARVTASNGAGGGQSGAGGGGGSPGTGATATGGTGATASPTGAVGPGGAATGDVGSGGGAGGGIPTTNVATAGGAGGGINGGVYATASGGVVGGALPVTVDTPVNSGLSGPGGGGGAARTGAAAQNGATGGRYGGGGGGGGASEDGFNSGAGGAGGPGIIIVISR